MPPSSLESLKKRRHRDLYLEPEKPNINHDDAVFWEDGIPGML